ncbi:hypothetical protein GGI02_002208 [Coemansia sp. RSA 2322]|nr:hypothetical protein GGI02_002208 [Coemansia sp. RSA 2322]
MTWDTPQVYSQGSPDSMCEQLSPVYRANELGYTCSSGLLQPTSSLGSCGVPYQVAYGLIGTTLFQTGIFSHVVVQGGSDLCRYTNQRSYYTLMSDYLMFASTVLNRTVYYYSSNNVTTPQNDANYSMEPPTDLLSGSVVVLGGDMYARQVEETTTSSRQQTSTSAIETVTSSDLSDEFSDDLSGSDSSGSTSNRTTVIVAVCSAVGALLLAVATYFAVRWWRAHVARTRDPYMETAAQRMLADDLGGASLPEDHFNALVAPPAYHPAEGRQLPVARNLDTVEELSPLPSLASSNDGYANEKTLHA